MVDVVKRVFKRHGAVTIETPVCELKETLTGKYGEDSKLIYDLADQGGEILALRYDLTVPFARFCAEHGIDTIKRYHISRVYRRDRPAMAKGRYREFYQCDFDIAGDFESMVPDAECIKIVTEILEELRIGDFVLKVNHRKILDGIFAVAGVPAELFRSICSAVDKLDKSEWAEVKAEMLQKGISSEIAETIWSYSQKKGGVELVLELLQDELLCSNELAKEGLEAMKKMFLFCDLFGVPPGRVSFDLSLARGLDYYTGVIYECVLVGQDVGSVAGGGRYDTLVGMFTKKGKSIPCVGVSLGLERLFTIVEKNIQGAVPSRPTQVLIIGATGKDDKDQIFAERLKLCNVLWANGISCETAHKTNAKLMTQIQLCEKELIKFAVIIGSGEIQQGIVKIRDIATREETEISREELPAKILELLL